MSFREQYSTWEEKIEGNNMATNLCVYLTAVYYSPHVRVCIHVHVHKNN